MKLNKHYCIEGFLALKRVLELDQNETFWFIKKVETN